MPGVAHACGHDVHTTALLGAGLALAEVARGGPAARPGPADLPARRGGHARRRARPDRRGRARRRAAGSSACTATRPSTSAGSVCATARSPAPPTASTVRLTGTRRAHVASAPDRGPHLRAGQARHRAPGRAVPPPRPACGRQPGVGPGRRGPGDQRDPRRRRGSVAPSGCSTRSPGATWSSGSAPRRTRSSAPYGVEAVVDYKRGVPPVVNECHVEWRLLGRAVDAVLGPRAVAPTAQSLGGEDFAWYLQPGARRDGPARHPRRPAGRRRPAPGEPADRRAGDLPWPPSCLAAVAVRAALVELVRRPR